MAKSFPVAAGTAWPNVPTPEGGGVEVWLTILRLFVSALIRIAPKPLETPKSEVEDVRIRHGLSGRDDARDLRARAAIRVVAEELSTMLAGTAPVFETVRSVL